MGLSRLHYVPIFMMVLFPLSFIISYGIAVYKNDVTPLFPYISDTGTFSPESCIFGQFLNLGAMSVAAIGYIRYLQLKDIHEINQVDKCIKQYNAPACVICLIGALGISVVGNFQESNVLVVHLAGAIVAFGLGSIYACIQTFICFKLYPLLGCNKINWLRLVLAVGSIISFISTFVFAILAAHYDSDKSSEMIKPKWKPGEAGWEMHFVSTLSEWILALCNLLFLFSFAYEFRGISMEELRVSNKFKLKEGF